MAYVKSNEVDINRQRTVLEEIWLMHYKNETKAARNDEGAASGERRRTCVLSRLERYKQFSVGFP
jgi:hypothetical protein